MTDKPDYIILESDECEHLANMIDKYFKQGAKDIANTASLKVFGRYCTADELKNCSRNLSNQPRDIKKRLISMSTLQAEMVFKDGEVFREQDRDYLVMSRYLPN